MWAWKDRMPNLGSMKRNIFLSSAAFLHITVIVHLYLQIVCFEWKKKSKFSTKQDSCFDHGFEADLSISVMNRVLGGKVHKTDFYTETSRNHESSCHCCSF